jgi:hypothetical protein
MLCGCAGVSGIYEMVMYAYKGTTAFCTQQEGRGLHSTFTHLRGGLVAEFWKLLIPLHLDLPP